MDFDIITLLGAGLSATVASTVAFRMTRRKVCLYLLRGVHLYLSDKVRSLGAGNCPPETLAEVAERLAVLWGLDPGKVRVTGWAFGGLVTWRDGVEFHAPAAELLATARNRMCPIPWPRW